MKKSATCTLLVLVTLAGCGDDDASSSTAAPASISTSGPAPDSTETSPVETTAPVADPTSTVPAETVPIETTTTPDGVPVIEWAAPPVEPVAVGPYTVGKCEGDAPLLCVSLHGALVGAPEYLAFPVATLPAFVAALEEAGIAAALEEHASGYMETFVSDRTNGCPDFQWEATGQEAVPFAGIEGVTYGFRGTADDGTVVERVVQFATYDGTALHVVGADALDPTLSCLEVIGTEFTPAALDDFEPYLRELVAASSLPA